MWYHFDAGHEMEWLHHKWSCDGDRWALIGGHMTKLISDWSGTTSSPGAGGR